MAFFKRKVQFNDDFGFGSNPVTKNQRMLNPDGSANIERTGLPWFKFDDTYTRLVTMSWPRFFFVILVAYLIVNTIFAVLYNVVGIENLEGANCTPAHVWPSGYHCSTHGSRCTQGSLMPSRCLAASCALE